MKKLIFLSLLMSGLFIAGCDDDDNETPAPVIDLAAESMEFSVSRTSATEGTVIISGIVKNVGADYVSGDNQQQVVLYEKYPGGQSTVVASKDFANLAAGATIEVKYSTSWRTSVEFPPSFILSISYGPDIYIDGNEQNDDENPDNNRREITGAQINEQF